MTGGYSRNAQSLETANGQFAQQQFFNQWNYGFNLNWELDFWGRFRRAVESNNALLDASVEDYDDTLGHLVGRRGHRLCTDPHHPGTNSVYPAKRGVAEKTLIITQARSRGGTTSELDVYQARSTLEQTEAQIPEFEISLRQTCNNLCILLGMPPEELEARLGPQPIPTAPPEVAVGMPADLLRRRPDVRRAERQAAAQSAQIGVAEADFYPAVSLDGTLRLLGAVLSRPLPLRGPHRQRRPFVPMEPPELRPDPQQRPAAGRQVPGVGDHLPADRAERRSGGGERTGDLPPRRAAHESPGRQRGRHGKGGRDSSWPSTRRGPAISRGSHRSSRTWCYSRTCWPRPGGNRHRPDPSLPGPGRRMATPADRLHADSLAGQAAPGRPSNPCRPRAPSPPWLPANRPRRSQSRNHRRRAQSRSASSPSCLSGKIRIHLSSENGHDYPTQGVSDCRRGAGSFGDCRAARSKRRPARTFRP